MKSGNSIRSVWKYQVNGIRKSGAELENRRTTLMVIDTMVFAYALLYVENRYQQAVAALETVDRIIVPDSAFAELGNVIWQWIQFRQLPLQVGLDALQDAEALVDIMISSSQIRDVALKLAVEANYSFYDTLFVAAAIQFETQVLTSDRKLADKFGDRIVLLG